MSDDGLDTYRDRRDFRKTPEPKGDGGSDEGPIFVVQEHDASSRHWDFRLEVDGALESWAVPKGPSTDPSEKRLAVRTEAHPLEYADFEGVIPEDEYGAGTVIVWDAGPYRNLRAAKRTEGGDGDEDGGDDGEDETVGMSEALEEGKLAVWLEGKKLRGGWALIHAKPGGDPEAWLLVKMDDEEADARRNPTSTEPESVLIGRTVEEVAEEEVEEDEEEGDGGS